MRVTPNLRHISPVFSIIWLSVSDGAEILSGKTTIALQLFFWQRVSISPRVFPLSSAIKAMSVSGISTREW